MDSADAEKEDKQAIMPKPTVISTVAGSLSGEEKEENAMPEYSGIEMTRKQLYDEIWEISVARVAKKYDLPYAHLMKQIKEASIPIPPSGYWTKLNFNKPVTKLELPEPADEKIFISRTVPVARKKKHQVISEKNSGRAEMEAAVAETLPTLESSALPVEGQTMSVSIPKKDDASEVAQMIGPPETYEQYGQTYNIYDRETLYKEVWLAPVTEVAKRYGVSDVAIRKVCQSLDIPTPPVGYWAKLRAGKPVTRIPLPISSKPAKKSGVRTGTEYTPQIERETLAFLNEEDKTVVLSVATQIRIPDENAKRHPTIVAHRKAIMEWKKKHREQEARSNNRRGMDATLFLADTVSEKSLPRVLHIFDALIKAMEPLGCSLTSDLKFIVNRETVSISVTEAQDEIKHMLTKEENIQLLKYEEDKRRHSWASKPKIRKYDYVYNGRISFSVYTAKSFRDCKSYVIEDRLGDLMIALYEASDILRQEREAREEAERKRQEEERRKEERRQRFNEEVDQTLMLENISEDYDIACKIRRYIAAVEASRNLDPKTMEWIEWAKAKADWYDPTIDREDEFFGKRDHKKNADQKKLERNGYKWW
ncbi:hypothetical protein QJQ58_09620 [Paenibacillus dendritiformis]|uniref:hypothetical protein n=1 Tax=Paenibacillus dendritiformis TaxID=130049 RepID=UPI00248ABE1E|nr:hypothetical protein [Paenibacillus dendritiformis]WGU96464.1 hypothetical protein QJQ58_09620 [Paenibacillus dendritiformis]